VKLLEENNACVFLIIDNSCVGLRLLRTTIRSIFTLICVLQIGLLSASIASPELHFLLFHTHATTDSGYSCADHSNSESSNDEKPSENDQYCPVDIYSQGLILPDSSISAKWEYINYAEFQFSLTEISLPNFSAKLIKQRAPPLS